MITPTEIDVLEANKAHRRAEAYRVRLMGLHMVQRLIVQSPTVHEALLWSAVARDMVRDIYQMAKETP